MKLPSRSLLAALFFSSSIAVSAQSPWRFSAGYSPLIGLKTEFSGFGNFAAPGPALPAPAPGQNYFYLDGSVQVDGSGNAGGLTSFFSYQNNAQYDPTANGGSGAINFTTLAGGGLAGAGSVEENSAAAGSFDFSAFLDLGHVSFIPSAVQGRSATWGLRMGGQYSRIEVGNRDTLGVGVTTITDSFSTGGAVPPLAPYTGPFSGLGFTLGDMPIRTLGTGTALISGSRDLDVHLIAAQFGAYVEIPLTQKLDLTLESGVLLALATGSYRYETTVAAGGATQGSSGYEQRTRFLPGFYAGIGLLYHVTEKIGIQAGVRYQYLKGYDITANGSNASLSFDSAFSLNVGVVYRF